MTLFMETTKIDANKTVAEIQSLLGQYGCSGIMIMYEGGEVKSLCFQIVFKNRELPFKLPCRWESIYKIMQSEIKRPREGKFEDLKAQAKRVAWRQILRWVQAQLALVDTDMVQIQEVFFSYMQVNIEGQTFYESIEQKGFPALEHKASKEV